MRRDNAHANRKKIGQTGIKRRRQNGGGKDLHDVPARKIAENDAPRLNVCAKIPANI
jgi:hypothetical protein